jgi:hypothetical protein
VQQTLIIEDVTSYSFKSRCVGEINIIDLGEREYPRYIDGLLHVVKVKIKIGLEQTMKTQGGIRSTALLFL